MKKLFCLPYAGSSATFYYTWKDGLQGIEIVPIELAGRGQRLQEDFYHSLDEAILDAYEQIIQKARKPYAIFGHSMGSLMTLLVTFMIQERQQIPMPNVIFCSGRDAPHVAQRTQYQNLPDKELIKLIKSWGGLRSNALSEEVILEVFLPIIRADIRLVENYTYVQKDQSLSCKLVVMSGSNDPICRGNETHWAGYSIHPVEYHVFEGGHFFLHEQKENVHEVIKKKILM